MRIGKGKISSIQLMILIISVLQGSTLTSTFISVITKQDTWIFLLMGSAITALLLYVYTSLGRKFPGKNLVQINSKIYGSYLGSIISILYVFFFWFLIPANARLEADFFATYVFSDIGTYVFVIGIVLICAYAVGKGIETIARISLGIVIITTLIAVILPILTVKEMRLSNFFPVFQVNLKEFTQGIDLMVSIPYGELVVLLMIFSHMRDIRQVKRYTFWGLIIGSIYFLSVSLRNTAVLGSIGSISAYPSYELAKLINIGEIITRIESVIALILLLDLFVKISLHYYAAVVSIAQLLKLRDYKPLIIPVGIISIILAISMYDSPVDEAYSAVNIYPIYAIPCVILLPITSLIITYIRKLA
ncbi:MAG: endospore germination permease [Bacillota bacterium]|nr:endospore germination permease [Bacillota bacterium]